MGKIAELHSALKDYAIGIRDHGEKLKMIEKGLRMDSDAETRGILLISRANTWDGMGKSGEAVKLLQTLRDDENQTIWTRTTAGELLKVVGIKKK